MHRRDPHTLPIRPRPPPSRRRQLRQVDRDPLRCIPRPPSVCTPQPLRPAVPASELVWVGGAGGLSGLELIAMGHVLHVLRSVA